MSFEFTRERRERLDSLLEIYPTRRAALLPALHLVQEQLGYISPEGEEHVARILDLPVIDVHEVLTFYTLYRTRPMGRRHIRVCTSISCWVRGCRGVQRHLEEKLGVASGGTTADGEFSWEAVQQCMGACELAPMMQVGDDYHGPLDGAEVDRILDREREQGRKGGLEIAPPVDRIPDGETSRGEA
ncbi:MAG: NADH-quinone oxidoreductase subunit NuoE [Acidobacteriota bacterium]|nr:NADH-quinone oxidoreductase subunit NuoE [Acidobacteriota bacterium]